MLLQNLWCPHNVVRHNTHQPSAGRGAFFASQVFISTSLLYLASEQAGCLDEEGNLLDTCDAKVYGFHPESIITNLAVVSGLLSAIVSPFLGAVVDYTDQRRRIGGIAAFLIVAIQAAQIYTVESTWFAMAILKTVDEFLFQVFCTMFFAYWPELTSELGDKVMENVSPKITMVQFLTQEAYMILVIVCSYAANANSVVTGHISQGINTVVLITTWGLAWSKFLPKAEAKHKLPQGKSLMGASITQNIQTIKEIKTKYKNSTMWYMLALCFAEAGASAFTICSVPYLSSNLHMDSYEIGVVFLIVLFTTVPGGKFAERVLKWTNYNTCWRLCMLFFSIVTAIAVFVLEYEEYRYLVYFFAALWGFALGWFYPTEFGFFAVLVSPGQATEMAGLYNFCTLIISWCPPFIFTAMIEYEVHLSYALLHLVTYFLIAIGLLSCMPRWGEVMEEVRPTESLPEKATAIDDEERGTA